MITKAREDARAAVLAEVKGFLFGLVGPSPVRDASGFFCMKLTADNARELGVAVPADIPEIAILWVKSYEVYNHVGDSLLVEIGFTEPEFRWVAGHQGENHGRTESNAGRR